MLKILIFLSKLFLVFLFEDRDFLDEFGDGLLLLADGECERETEDDKQCDGNKENEIGEGLKAEPVSQFGEWVWEDCDEGKDDWKE